MLKAKRMRRESRATPEPMRPFRNLVRIQALVRNRRGADPARSRCATWGAIEQSERRTRQKAKDYRKVRNPEDLGTAVNIVSMVFGNMGDDSGTGVAFTRNPSTGEKQFYGEFLLNAQGEDVVAGTRTPLDIDQMAERLPGAYKELIDTQDRLEKHYADMQDLEFTVERGKLFLLQTRSGKRTAAAAVRIARDMVSEGLIGRDEAVLRVPAADLDICYNDHDPSYGLPALPRVAAVPEQRAASLYLTGHGRAAVACG